MFSSSKLVFFRAFIITFKVHIVKGITISEIGAKPPLFCKIFGGIDSTAWYPSIVSCSKSTFLINQVPVNNIAFGFVWKSFDVSRSSSWWEESYPMKRPKKDTWFSPSPISYSCDWLSTFSIVKLEGLEFLRCCGTTVTSISSQDFCSKMRERHLRYLFCFWFIMVIIFFKIDR